MQGGVVFRVGTEPYYLPATIAMRVVPVPRIGRVPGSPLDLGFAEGPELLLQFDRRQELVVGRLASDVGLDRLRPPGGHQTRLRKAHEKVAQRGRVEDVGIVDGGNGSLHQ